MVAADQLVSYEETGSGERAVVFLHGWRSNKEVWNGVAKRLQDSRIERLKMYALDLPGFGSSPAPKQPWTVGDYAYNVQKFLEKQELKHVIVVGHSFGGRVGIKLAANYPELVSKLVLVDSAGFADTGRKQILMNWVTTLARPFFRPQFMRGLRKGIYHLLGAGDYVATPELRETFLNVIGEDLSEDMKKISCPALIIFGKNDKDTPVSYGERMKSYIKDSKLEVLKDAGHFSFLDQQDSFAEKVINFIS